MKCNENYDKIKMLSIQSNNKQLQNQKGKINSIFSENPTNKTNKIIEIIEKLIMQFQIIAL